jgi:hypothetical protein
MSCCSLRRIALFLCPGLLVAAFTGCSSAGDVPVPTTMPSNIGSDNVGSIVGDGSSVELEPGSNLPPTDSERSVDESPPAGSVGDSLPD